MKVDTHKVGHYIKSLRTKKKMTQSQLAERLSISFQAVSKWERGETLPDTSLLLDIADILETTADNILNGGERVINYTRKITFKEMREGIECIENMRSLLGKDNIIYRSAIDGINSRMNVDIEEAFETTFTKEAFIAEAIVQNIKAGSYIDLTDINNGFQYDHWKQIISEYAVKYNII